MMVARSCSRTWRTRAVAAGLVVASLVVPAAGRAQAVGIDVPRAVGRAMFTDEMSLRDIRSKALTHALHDAVSEALGRRLTAMT